MKLEITMKQFPALIFRRSDNTEIIPDKSSKYPVVTKNEKKKPLNITTHIHYDLVQMWDLFKYPFNDKHNLQMLFTDHDLRKLLELESDLDRFENPQKQSIEEIVTEQLRMELNKLTLDNYFDVITEITKIQTYPSISFLETFAHLIHRYTLNQKQFSNLYSLLVQTFYHSLNKSDVKNLGDSFLSLIIKDAITYLKVLIPEQQSYNAFFNIATFYGCLAARDLIPIENVYDLIQFYMKQSNAVALVIVSKILVPCGKLIEEKIPQFITEVIPKLESFSVDRKVFGYLRSLVFDVLEARNKNWDAKDLMDQIVDKDLNVHNNPITSLTEKPKEVDIYIEEKRTIPIVQNKYKYLLLDDDDEDYDDDEEDYEDKEEDIEDDNCEDDNCEDQVYEETPVKLSGITILEQWIMDHEIASEYSPKFLKQFLHDIVTISLNKAPEAASFFDGLKKKGMYDPRETIKAINEVYNTYSSNNDYPQALSYLAIIYAKLVEMGDQTIDDYQLIFKKPNLMATFHFLQHLDHEKLNEVRRSIYWQSLRWIPDDLDAVDVLNKLYLMNQISHEFIKYFPLLNNLNNVWDLIAEEEQPGYIVSRIKEMSPYTTGFVLGIIRIILIEVDDLISAKDIISLFKNFRREILNYLNQGGKHQMKVIEIEEILKESE